MFVILGSNLDFNLKYSEAGKLFIIHILIIYVLMNKLLLVRKLKTNNFVFFFDYFVINEY